MRHPKGRSKNKHDVPKLLTILAHIFAYVARKPVPAILGENAKEELLELLRGFERSVLQLV
jgi:hypothetical protein